MKQWYLENADGSIEQVYSVKKPRRNARALARFGDLAIEQLDGKGNWVPRDAEALGAAIDAGHDADHGPHRRLIDYAIKEIEARLILGTLQTEGRLAQEAALRGISVAELAGLVLTRATANRAEIDRVTAKLALKQE